MFQDVDVVMFLVPLGHLDNSLYDDGTKQCHEQLQLWDELVNSKWLQSSKFVLYFTQFDIFKKRLETKAFRMSHIFYLEQDTGTV